MVTEALLPQLSLSLDSTTASRWSAQTRSVKVLLASCGTASERSRDFVSPTPIAPGTGNSWRSVETPLGSTAKIAT